jgi:hypothetical protein
VIRSGAAERAAQPACISCMFFMICLSTSAISLAGLILSFR